MGINVNLQQFRGDHISFEQDKEQCLAKLNWATNALELQVCQEQLAKIADLIVQTMTGPWRYFHTPEHIFEVGGEQEPIEVLSALFHDVVYVQVDQSVNFNLSYYLVSYVREYREQLFIKNREDLPDDVIFDIVMELFGFEPGEPLTALGGQNEFLSAIVGAKVLQEILPVKLLVEVVACIEATIPFRGINDKGQTPSDILFEYLVNANGKFRLGFTQEEIINTVKHAVRMSNRDVGSFANPSSARFLDGTWSLLPETNHNLHNPASYTVAEYRIALQKMEGFMGFLNENVIFQEYAGEPPAEVFAQLKSQAKHNLEIGRLYLGSKLLAIGVLEALSLRLGQNLPISSMMGELPSNGLTVDKLEDLIPPVPEDKAYPMANNIEAEVLSLLENGRHTSSEYDLKNSPLTTFMVNTLGFQKINYLRDRAKEFFKGNISGEEFLAECDPQVIQPITQGMLELFDRRKLALVKNGKV